VVQVVHRQGKSGQSRAKAAADSKDQQEEPRRAHLRSLRREYDCDREGVKSIVKSQMASRSAYAESVFTEEPDRVRHPRGERDYSRSFEITASGEERRPADLLLVSAITSRRQMKSSSFHS